MLDWADLVMVVGFLAVYAVAIGFGVKAHSDPHFLLDHEPEQLVNQYMYLDSSQTMEQLNLVRQAVWEANFKLVQVHSRWLTWAQVWLIVEVLHLVCIIALMQLWV